MAGKAVLAGRLPRAGRRSWLATAVLLLLAGVAPPAAVAQQDGRWSWDTRLGLRQRGYDRLVDRQELGTFEETELLVDLGLNGFIVHPAIAAFRIDLELLLNELAGGRRIDTDRTGFGARLDLLPRGGFPLSLFFKRELFDFEGEEGAVPLTLAVSPDTTTRWGGRFRVRRGPLRGLLLGLDEYELEFVDPDVEKERQRSQLLDWSRSGKRARHHVRLERRLREYGVVRLEYDDLVMNLDERAQLSENWRWDLSASGLSRDVLFPDGQETSTEDYRLHNRLVRSIGERDRLDLSYAYGQFRPDGSRTSDGHTASVFYRWYPAERWEIAPFALYATQEAGDSSLDSPRVGLSVTYSRAARAWDAVLSGRASYGKVDLTGPIEQRDEATTSLGLIATLARGAPRRVRKELEVELSRNQLRTSLRPLLDLPDLGLPRDGLGTEDFYRGRVGLRHHWDSRSVSAWAEWSRRESVDDLRLEDFEAETLLATAQYGGAPFSFQVTVGETTATREILGDQEVSYVSAAASWKPWRVLRLRALYRADTRDFTSVPAIDGERAEVGASFDFGRLTFGGEIFEASERPEGAAERENRGFRWSVVSRFGGWLPIVTGTKRRGVIR